MAPSAGELDEMGDRGQCRAQGSHPGQQLCAAKGSPPKGRGKGDQSALKHSLETERKMSVYLSRTKSICFAEQQFSFNKKNIYILVGKVLSTQKFVG